MPINIFVSYSHADKPFFDQLSKHLKPLEYEGVIRPWSDRQIAPGAEFGPEILSALEMADVILLLVSVDFVASQYCWSVEMKRAIERHDAGSARVIPIILRPVDWHHSPFGKLLALPRDGRPIASWPDPDEALLNIAQSLRGLAFPPRDSRTTPSGHALENATVVIGMTTVVQFLGVTGRARYRVFLDGRPIEPRDLPDGIALGVSPGPHSVQVKFMLGTKSNLFFFRAQGGATVNLEIALRVDSKDRSFARNCVEALGLAEAFVIRPR
jgi:hypothetical protein